jgi:CheY-like chemotaxis protein
MRILVVDDEPAVREALERILQLEGFDVEVACDGREAVRSQAAAPADAILLDVLMPELDGLEVCRRMRDTGDRTPVLMLTARDEVCDRVAGLEAGADDYLPKPFALEELLARLRALLRRSGWMDQREVLRFDDIELDPHSHEVRRGAARGARGRRRRRAGHRRGRRSLPGRSCGADVAHRGTAGGVARRVGGSPARAVRAALRGDSRPGHRGRKAARAAVARPG